MFRITKTPTILVALLAASMLFSGVAEAQKSRSSFGGSRSSFGGSRSSFSSGSSSSKYSAPKSSSSSSKYSAPKSSSSSKPKYTAPSSSSSKPKYTAPSSSSSKPKYTAPSSSSSKPKYTAPSSSSSSSSSPSKPKYTAPSSSSSSTTSTTSTTTTSDKARANKQASSQSKYATSPPKPSYKTSDGKEVNVRTDSKHVEHIRNQPNSRYTPEARRQYTTDHIRTYNYSHDYDWYRSQPVVYVGGGYSSAFWWMMTEWSAQRRAEWFYHNRNNIEQDAYERGMRDAEVAKHIAELEAKKVVRNVDYVDPELAKDPSLMYDEKYIEAAIGPKVVKPPVVENKGWSTPGILVMMIFIIVAIYAIYLLFFKVKWVE